MQTPPSTPAAGETLTVLPAPALRRFVRYYWFSAHNRDARCCVLPDGCVEWVFEMPAASAPLCRLHGPADRSTALDLNLASHYLGVSFQPGQARYFFSEPPHELIATGMPVTPLDFTLTHGLGEAGSTAHCFARLDAMLSAQLAQRSPHAQPVDRAIAALCLRDGRLNLAALADRCGRSQRQLERDFHRAVGLGGKTFARICRFRRATRLLATSNYTAASVAAELGYTDQSHLTREFRRFGVATPRRYAANPVGFLQDRWP